MQKEKLKKNSEKMDTYHASQKNISPREVVHKCQPYEPIVERKQPIFLSANNIIIVITVASLSILVFFI